MYAVSLQGINLNNFLCNFLIKKTQQFSVGTYLAWKKWERSNSEGNTASLCVLSQNFCWCLWKLLESLVLNF